MNFFKTILCRYNEIGTKGGNRAMFEKRLMENLRLCCRDICPLQAVRTRGRIFLHKKDSSAFTPLETERLTEHLKRCFGLESFSFCIEAEPGAENILSMVGESAEDFFAPALAALPEGKRLKYRVRARRGDKSFPLRSKEIEIQAATLIEARYGEKLEVDLMDPELSVGIEVREKTALVYYHTVRAPGGLPVGCNPPVLALLSGGIDSPVACLRIMKRGCPVDFLTFHSFPYTPMESVEKVARIAAKLNLWQSPGRLFSCNIAPVQKLIRDHCSARFRTVLYRRMMMRLAAMLCRKNKLFAIVTGDSVGQVASQTVENLGAITPAAEMLVLRPLCGMDKNETILEAKEADTFDISIEPMPDSCTVFAPPSPVLHASAYAAEREEKRIPDREKALQEIFDAVQVEEIPPAGL